MSSFTCAAGFDVTCIGPGRALFVQPDGRSFISRGLTVYASDDDCASWSRVISLPSSMLRKLASVSRMACRALRHEVRAFLVLSDGGYVAASREWVFHGRPGDRLMMKSDIALDGVALMPPMSLSLGPDDRVLWGEYGGNRERRAMRIFVSDDRGASYHLAYTFPPSEIRHLHNIVYDASIGEYWVLAGDHGDEPGIGRLSADFRDFQWVVKGEQKYRAVRVFDFGDRLVYATDTEKEPNALMSLDKASGRVERLLGLGGSCIYACTFGDLRVLTTSVEPSGVNTSRHATIWASRDGDSWREILRAEKDRWNATYFQFGSLVLPSGTSDRETVLFSGQAIKGLDGRVFVGRLAREAREGS